jgi:ubiquitin-conjugating enzyme E2 C
LGEPNNESPLNPYAAGLWDNQQEYGHVLRKKYEEYMLKKK